MSHPHEMVLGNLGNHEQGCPGLRLYQKGPHVGFTSCVQRLDSRHSFALNNNNKATWDFFPLQTAGGYPSHRIASHPRTAGCWPTMAAWYTVTASKPTPVFFLSGQTMHTLVLLTLSIFCPASSEVLTAWWSIYSLARHADIPWSKLARESFSLCVAVSRWQPAWHDTCLGHW